MAEKSRLLPSNMSRRKFVIWLWSFLRNKKMVVTFISLGTIIIIFFQSIVPILIGTLIDEVLSHPTGILTQDMAKVANICSILLLSVLIRGILNYTVNGVNDWLAFKVESEVRAEFYHVLQSKSISFHSTTRTGDIMALATNDTRQMSELVSPGIRLTSQLFVSTVFVAVLTISAIDIRFAGLALLFIPPYIWGVKRYGQQLGPVSRVFNQQFSSISVKAQDSVVGAKIVRAFSGEEFETRNFSTAVTDFRNTWVIRQKIQSEYFPMLMLYILMGISTLYGAILVLEGQLTLGKLIAFNGLLFTLTGPTDIINFALAMTQSGLAGASRIYTMMQRGSEEETEEESFHKLTWPAKITGKIEFRNVTFRYNPNDPPVLENISFIVQPGETVAIVGATGSGKSTLTKLLLRFYKPEKGEILLDDINIENYRLVDLRRHIGHIEQDVFLFSTSIRNNIAFGRYDASNEEIVKVAKFAQAHDFIGELKEGYDTIVGERGYTLSGGQRQRIAIARAFITNPTFLILDDSTSALDSETEEKIVLAIDALVKNRTSFIITHRVSTIRKADHIIVLKHGQLIAEGTHNTLIHISVDYRRIFGKFAALPPIKAPNAIKPVDQYEIAEGM